MLSMIVAVTQNGVIGRDGDLPWHLPEDLKHFKQSTLGKAILMGRKTWDSIDCKALPKRRNIVLTRQAGFSAPGAEVVQSLDEAKALVGDDELMIVGGSQLYKQALPQADLVYRTLICGEIEGDSEFPDLPESEWELSDLREHPVDEKHAYAMRFETWRRKA